MVQIEYSVVSTKTGNKSNDANKLSYGGEKGSYSFMILPNSIVPFECEYMIRLKKEDVLNGLFNNVRISYFNEKDRKKEFKVKKIDISKGLNTFQADEEWILLK